MANSISNKTKIRDKIINNSVILGIYYKTCSINWTGEVLREKLFEIHLTNRNL